jgi:hypothetical protein
VVIGRRQADRPLTLLARMRYVEFEDAFEDNGLDDTRWPP